MIIQKLARWTRHSCAPCSLPRPTDPLALAAILLGEQRRAALRDRAEQSD